ncbi:MAG: acetylxylan esterase [Planctomycetaceae bacterium]|nr:acetylxylan esterase [Planctomycetaceae bacterium]
MPLEPAQQFLAYIHERHRQLRGDDKAPQTLEAWQVQKSHLRQKLLDLWGGFPDEPCDLDPQTLGELQRDGYRVEKIVFKTRPGVQMTANAYVPAGTGKRPAVLCVHGHWKGAKQDPVPQSRCIGLARLGFFVLAVDAFGAGERGIGKALGEYHGEMTGATLWPVGLPLSGLQVYENMRAVDFLLTRPEVDGTKLGITGASGGGNQTMYAGAFDERFGCVVPVCSVGNYRSYLGAAACVCEIVPDIVTYTEEGALLAMVAPRALMVINATRDAFQFSVGEAQKSIAAAQHVFRLYGKAGNITHDIFESGHDYGKAMREAMYGWMTLHLKGEGQGNPIPEPPLIPEDPETLRCYPGQSRPENFVTLPKFAAAQADRILAEHNRERHTHPEHWQNSAMRMKHALTHQVLGGTPLRGDVPVQKPENNTLLLETEPGIEITAVVLPGDKPKRQTALVVDLEGIKHARETELVQALTASGWKVVCADLRATGRYAVAGDTIGRAPDHNSTEWATLTGRPLLGQWAWDVRCLVSWLESGGSKAEVGDRDLTLLGVGPAGLVALVAAIDLPAAARVVVVDSLVSFRSDVPYVGQRMGLFAPRILRDVGDIPHLAALLAPRRLVISGGVNGGGETQSDEELKNRFAYTRDIYRLLGVDAHLTVAASAKATDLVKRLG